MRRRAWAAGLAALVVGSWFLLTPIVAPTQPPAANASFQDAPGWVQTEKKPPADNSYCFVCHANYEEERLAKVHQVIGVGCEKCHGASVKHSGDEDNITPPDKMFAKVEVDRFCIRCHTEARLKKEEIHKEWLSDDERDDTCNDCHAKLHHLAVRTRQWDKKSGKLVADDGVRMMAQSTVGGASSPAAAKADPLFARPNLVAWCIVPFDAKRRGPEERAAMLEKLGFKQLAYDWRAEHVPTFDAEIEALKKHGVKLTAFWFPGGLNKEARTILDVLRRHHVHAQLWVTRGGGPVNSPDEQQRRVEAEAAALKPIAEEAAKIGCTVELYNHGGWFGEPENQIAIIEKLNLPNVGIVYNLHHGHEHLDRFASLLTKMMPYLHAINLNGMSKNADRQGQKILPLGQGDLDLALLRAIRESGYHGPIGILNHTSADAEARLQDNLDGLDWLVAQLDGRPAGPKPVPRSWQPPKPAKL